MTDTETAAVISSSGDEVTVRLLGTVDAIVGGRRVEPRGVLGRSVLARLALADRHSVSEDSLAAALWDRPPERPAATIRPAISKLRRALGSDCILRDDAGFRLGPRVRVDADVAAAAGEPPIRLDAVEAALARWRGPALVDVASTPYFLGARFRLEELRLDLADRRAEALIEASMSTLALVDLSQQARLAPHRESTHLLLARALEGVGDRRRALQVLSDFRSRATVLGRGVSADLDLLESALLGVRDARSPRVDPPDDRSAVAALLGRDADIGRIRGLLDAFALVTIVGTGGVGKTRLAIDVATRHPELTADVVLLADLESRPSYSLGELATAVAASLGVDHAGQAPLDTVADLIGDRERLLVLDNCEHILDTAAGFTAALLDRCAGLRVLATSRTPLGVEGEVVHRLSPLRTGASGDHEPSPAAALLIERGRSVGFGFDLSDSDTLPRLERICELLDGLPLAVELAAANLRLLGVDGLLDYLARGRVDVLEDDADRSRHGSLHATINWNRSMLGVSAGELLPQLSALPGWFTADQVADVIGSGAAVDDLAELVDASLIELRHDSHSVRYRLLEPIRQLLRSELDEDTKAKLRAGHGEWCLRLTERVDTYRRNGQLATAQSLIDLHVTDLAVALGDPPPDTSQDRLDTAFRQLAPLLHERPRPRLSAVVRAHAGDSVDGQIAMAWMCNEFGELADAVRLARRALGSLEPTDMRRCDAAFPAIYGLMAVGQLPEAIELATNLVRADEPSEMLSAACVASAAFAHAYLGQPLEAAAVVDRYRAVLEGCRAGGYVSFVRAELEMPIDLARSRVHSQRGVDEALADLSRTGVLRSSLQRVVIEIRAGEHSEAARRALEIIPELIGTGNTPTAWIGLRYAAQIVADMGGTAAAARAVRAAAGDPRSPRWPELAVDALAEVDVPVSAEITNPWDVWEWLRPELVRAASAT